MGCYPPHLGLIPNYGTLSIHGSICFQQRFISWGLIYVWFLDNFEGKHYHNHGLSSKNFLHKYVGGNTIINQNHSKKKIIYLFNFFTKSSISYNIVSKYSFDSQFRETICIMKLIGSFMIVFVVSYNMYIFKVPKIVYSLLLNYL